MPKTTVNIDLCQGCGHCAAACPKKIIKISDRVLNKKGFHPAEVTDAEKCTGCAFCAIMCPDIAIKVEK